MTLVCPQNRHARLPLPTPIPRNNSGDPVLILASHLISGLLHLLGVGNFSTPFLPASRRRRHDSCRGTCHFPSHHCYGSDSRFPPGLARSSLLAWLLHLASRLLTYLLMIRVTTRTYTHGGRLVIVALPLPFLYTTLTLVRPQGCTWFGFGSAFGFWLLSFLISCMAFRLEDTILALIRPPSCTTRLFSLVLIAYCLFRAIIIPLVTDCYGRQTNLGH